MTPKEKARELVESFTSFSSNEATTEDGFIYSEAIQLWNAKQCALIAVNEMLEELDHLAFDDFDYGTSKMMYWQEVKEEIKKL